MASSGGAASALSSASCSAFDGLKALFFIYFPFTCRGFPRADDSTHRLTGFEIALGQSVNHKQQNWSDKSDRVPAVAVRVRIGLGGVKWIIKYMDRRLKRHTMLGAIRSGLVRSQIQRTAAPFL